MPKIVDHEMQKVKVAKATWRIIRKYGMEQASVRNIADEAGISVGSMRHYFSTQSELLAYSMKLVSENVGRRIRNINFSGDLIIDIPNLVQEILPTNEEKRLEMEVWFAFVVKSMSDSSLRGHRNEVDDDLRAIFINIMEGLTEKGLAKSELNIPIEIERFYALIDGLAIHAILRPDKVSSEMIQRTIQIHLDSLCIP
ncbi:TetR/AcrR family transcriptional regulator [Paenibacillus pini]|uniref:Transcriptional regulator n=1 Tax=Paenibacillus pini JCM 16418 TaxID=1236976 RepID=W7YQ09_9BACL|nr:TetR/AcrR family transcriptional regulator [Paenibacillus pini]GAF10597.1 transcriptional regulator [Paenibacillus pini JCM 16418]